MQANEIENEQRAEQELVLFERQQRELAKHQTRYVYLPLQGSTFASQIRGGVPAGVIFPIVAPYGICNVRLLPDGAQTLYVTSPSKGVIQPKAAQPVAADPATRLLQQRIEQLEEQMASRGQEPANLAVYLHETAPLIETLLQYEWQRGAIEIQSLRGFSSATFERKRLNDLLFGPDEERPKTAGSVRARMTAVIAKAKAIKGQSDGADEAVKIMSGAAREILKAVDTAEAYCEERMRKRHLALDDPQNDPQSEFGNPRYSLHDERCLEFAGIAKRAEIKRQLIEDQRQAMEAFPTLLTVVSERDAAIARAIETQNERLASAFEKIGEIFERLAPPKIEQPETTSKPKKGGE